MGSNHLRRNYLQLDQEQQEIENVEEKHISKHPKPSKFALLMEENDDAPEPAKSSEKTRPTKRKNRKTKRTTAKEDEELDEDALLEAAIQSVKLSSAKKVEEDAAIDQTSSTLKVDTRQLDPDVELKQLIGKHMEMQGGRKTVIKQERNLRTVGKSIKMKQGWPPIRNCGFELEKVKESNGNTWFQVKHSEMYRNQQFIFATLRRNMDYESIIEVILTENPYHLESLLLLTQFYIMQEEANKANDSIERALFAVESASFKFNLLLPEHRLDYQWRDNRVIFNLLWQRVQVLMSKSCYNTALQYAKILFAKDLNNDPLAISLLFDVLALKSGNCSFLTAFYEEFNDERNLDMLPNFLYSTAYAYYRQFERSKKAYTRFPFVLSQILENLSVDSGKSLSKATIFYDNQFERETVGMKLLVKIYLHHTLSFWKQANQLAWLESTSTEFVRDYDTKLKSEAKEWREKYVTLSKHQQPNHLRRAKVFIGIPLNVKRHALLSGLPIDDGEVHDLYDPYPPVNSRASYWPERKLDEQIRQLTSTVEPDSSTQTSGSLGQKVVGFFGGLFRSINPQVTGQSSSINALAREVDENEEAFAHQDAEAQDLQVAAEVEEQTTENETAQVNDISGSSEVTTNVQRPVGANSTSGRRTDEQPQTSSNAPPS
ncbi:Hc38 [Aphelenchoides besseyi]|nr:Hc38 [Aphelenchoides besseyi]